MKQEWQSVHGLWTDPHKILSNVKILLNLQICPFCLAEKYLNQKNEQGFLMFMHMIKILLFMYFFMYPRTYLHYVSLKNDYLLTTTTSQDEMEAMILFYN